jgi:hypothetical protein
MSTTISTITADYLCKFNNLNLRSCSILLNTHTFHHPTTLLILYRLKVANIVIYYIKI